MNMSGITYNPLTQSAPTPIRFHLDAHTALHDIFTPISVA